MSLTFEEIEQHLSYIFNGKKYLYIEDDLFIFRFPSNDIKQRAEAVYRKAYKEAVASGMLPVAELEKLLEQRNLISSEDKNKVIKLKSQLTAQEILLGKTTIVKANQDRIKKVIYRLRTEIYNIEYAKKSKLLLSAENKAEEDRTFFICSNCVFDEYDRAFWPDYKEALKEDRLALKDDILINYLRFYSGLSTSIIRSLARSNTWRIRYVTSMKTSDSLFGVPTSDYTTDQLNLVYWSNYYQNIYEMMPEDRPSDIVIEDDESLDAYMKAFYEERNKDNAFRKGKSRRPGKLSAFDADEVIVTSSHELYQDIEYDKPREAQKLKDRVDIKKKTRKG